MSHVGLSYHFLVRDKHQALVEWYLGGENRSACRGACLRATSSNKSPSLMTLILNLDLCTKKQAAESKNTVIVIRSVIVHITYILYASINIYIYY
jgi:hypothetical protein